MWSVSKNKPIGAMRMESSDDPSVLKQEFGDFTAFCQRLIGFIPCTNGDYFAIPLRTLGRGQCCNHGGCGAPTLPFLAQGAVMAIEDAWVLAACFHRDGWWITGLSIHPHAASRGYWRRQIQMHGNIIWPIQLCDLAHTALGAGSRIAPHAWCVSSIGFTPMMYAGCDLVI